MNFKDTIFITHGNCLDGSTCAILFLAVGGKEKNLYFSSPGHDKTDEIVLDLLNKDMPIMMVDLSVSLEFAEKLNKTGKNIIIMDHHKTAIPLDEFSWCYIDKENTRCGSRMFFDFLRLNGFGQQIYGYRDLVYVSDDRDRWINDNPKTPMIVSLHNLFGHHLFIERFLKNSNLETTMQEQYALNIFDIQKKEYINKAIGQAFHYFKDFNGNIIKFAITAADKHQSEIGNDLCNDPFDDISFAIIVSANGGSVSFRGRKDCPIDLSEFAKSYGGGGHKLAAGCPLGAVLGKDLLESVVDSIWKKI
jgi:oligoribonuclease NrnB/cAMP/cGMP phosphodiesterase (DHH superfamily)